MSACWDCSKSGAQLDGDPAGSAALILAISVLIAGRLAGYRYLVGLMGQPGRFAERDLHQYTVVKAAYESLLDGPLERARLLEVGCGTRHAVTSLFHSAGARITGIDTALQPPGPAGLAPAVIRRNGLGSTLQNALRSLVFDPSYRRALQRSWAGPIRAGADTRVMSATALDFRDAEFDFVFSTAVFEHLPDVQAAVAEMARVLKPGGGAFISIHLFHSLSGGHSFDWTDPDTARPRRVPAWDHLLDDRFPAGVYLNRLRERDYRSAFECHFEIVEVTATYAGEQHLTDDVLRRLPGFSREELLRASVNFSLRKPPGGSRSTPRAEAQ
jgi:SAM-dependent methyltransferase